MSSNGTGTAEVDSRTLAASLAPLLRASCRDRLADITWFKADWQRGGAATGTSTYRRDDGAEVPVVLKLPVGPRELIWTKRLHRPGEPEPVTPRLYASGEGLGGYDLAWIVIERFRHGPLGTQWHDQHVPRIADALARFHASAAAFAVDQPPRVEPWDDLLRQAQESVQRNEISEKQRWIGGLKSLRGRLDEIVAEWNGRAVDQWLHGDMHVANAMSRHGMDAGAVSLIDLAEVHAGHWIEDAVYLERQLWARPDRMKPVRPIKAVADARRRHGLPVDDGYPRLAMIRRALLAATAPKFIKTEGHPRHLVACLEWLERALRELK